MKRKLVVIAVVLSAAFYGLTAGAAGEWLRESNVWLRGIVYAGTSKVAITNAAGNLASTTGAFSGNVTVGGTEVVTGAATMSSTLSVAGATTLASTVKMTSVGTYVPTGTTQANATPITTTVAAINGTTAAQGVVLPAAVTGLIQWFGNIAATGVKVYPAPSGYINGTQDSAFTAATLKSYACVAYDTAKWLCAGN
jgi:hypothetical protein